MIKGTESLPVMWPSQILNYSSVMPPRIKPGEIHATQSLALQDYSEKGILYYIYLSVCP